MAAKQKQQKVEFKELSITGWKSGKGIDISTGTIEFTYYESILSNHVSATIVVGDTGNTVGDGKNMKDLLNGLPVRGGEAVRVNLKDPKGNILKYVGKEDAFYVNTVRDALGDTTRNVFAMDLCTKEFLANEQARVVKRYSGKISETIKNILKNVLKTNKKNDIEETSNSYNFIGNIKKCFYTLTWLGTKSIPTEGYGKTAGFFFFETQDGYKFKSIDTLVGPTQGGGSADKKNSGKYEFTQTDKKKEGYEKIFVYNVNKNINVQEKLAVGAYDATFLFLNPFTFEVKKTDFSMTKEQKNNVKTAGNELDFVAKEFRAGPTRGLSSILDVGTMVGPGGIAGIKQLAQWKLKKEETNDKVKERMVQAITRYNQIFSVSVDVMVEANFSLKAGETVWCEFPSLGTKTDRPSKETSGLYLISSLCHKVTPDRSWTTMNLIRDSFGVQKAARP